MRIIKGLSDIFIEKNITIWVFFSTRMILKLNFNLLLNLKCSKSKFVESQLTPSLINMVNNPKIPIYLTSNNKTKLNDCM